MSRALDKLGGDPSQNELLGELINLDGGEISGGSLVDNGAVGGSLVGEDLGKGGGEELRHVVVDGSNVAMRWVGVMNNWQEFLAVVEILAGFGKSGSQFYCQFLLPIFDISNFPCQNSCQFLPIFKILNLLPTAPETTQSSPPLAFKTAPTISYQEVISFLKPFPFPWQPKK